MITYTTDVDPFTLPRVEVLWNYNRYVWTIRSKGKVIAYADEPIALTDCTFYVNHTRHDGILSGRLKRHRRDQVAWVIGKLTRDQQVVDGRRVTFHFWERRDFYEADTGATVDRADAAVFSIVPGADGNPRGLVHV